MLLGSGSSLRGELLISRLKVRFLHGSPLDRGAATPPDLFFWASSCNPSRPQHRGLGSAARNPRHGPSVTRVGRIGVRGDLAEEAEDPRLVAALLLAVCEIEGAPGDLQRLVPAAGQEMRLPEVR